MVKEWIFPYTAKRCDQMKDLGRKSISLIIHVSLICHHCEKQRECWETHRGEGDAEQAKESIGLREVGSGKKQRDSLAELCRECGSADTLFLDF